MPTTINGIGTHYYGHKHSEKRSGTCRSCGRTTTLESYDTRLWFVIVYIPIIPLGRKRIIDQCPLCKRHYVADADQWETQKQLNVSGALERYHADPTPEHAIEAHQQMLNFHQMGEAAELRRQMAEQFRQNAKVQAYLGLALRGMGLAGDATSYFQRALELRPDLPEARVGVAYDHMNAGRLKEARTLLDFLEKPGAVQLYSLEPIETLADAFARAGERTEALELYQVLLNGLPQIGEIAAFRTKVKQCEKLLGKRESILPKQKFSWKRFFGRQTGGAPTRRSPLLTWRGLAIVCILLVLGGGIALVRNEYIRRHRALYLVNAFKEPATVEVSGMGAVKVGWRPERMELKEGKYHVTVTGPVKEEYDIEVQTRFGERWASDDDVWVVNVGGEALLLEMKVTYQASSPPPPKVTPHYGARTERVLRVTHPFTPLPDTVQMKSNETRQLTHLDRFSGGAADLIGHLQGNGRRPEAIQLAEWRLRMHPDDDQTLSAYVAMADPKQAETFLRAGLKRRPVEVNWHRAYQNLQQSAAWLEVEYDTQLSAEPQNSSLLYLRGRVTKDGAVAEAWYGKAQAADPQNPYPQYALGYRRAAEGRWDEARPFFARAAELRPQQAEFVAADFTCRLALREFDALEKELKARLAASPRDALLAIKYVDILAAQDRNAEAATVVKTFTKALTGLLPQDAAAMLAAVRHHFLYSTGDIETLGNEAKKEGSSEGRNALFIAFVEQGKLAEAARLHPVDEAKLNEPYHYLTVGLAWLVAGEPAKADEWFRRAIQLLAAGSADDVRAAKLLSGEVTVTSERLNELVQVPRAKCILLAALGMRYAERRAELYGAAQNLNVERSYPFHLIRRITEAH